jgi:hypothetical protein
VYILCTGVDETGPSGGGPVELQLNLHLGVSATACDDEQGLITSLLPVQEAATVQALTSLVATSRAAVERLVCDRAESVGS